VSICGRSIFLSTLNTGPNDYSDYVEHSRFGRGPRLRPDLATDGDSVVTTWPSIEIQPAGFRPSTGRSCHIAGTGIPVDMQAVHPKSYPPGFSHYFDLDKWCWGCGRRYIFFAEEQKYLYETLHLSIWLRCGLCVECRNKNHRQKTRPFAQAARKYQDLLGIKNRTPEQTLELIASGIEMAEKGQGGELLLERLRHLVRTLPAELPEVSACREAIARLWADRAP
jgi:Probable zinc-ribbon domain